LIAHWKDLEHKAQHKLRISEEVCNNKIKLKDDEIVRLKFIDHAGLKKNQEMLEEKLKKADLQLKKIE